jgi:hypothetical protein
MDIEKFIGANGVESVLRHISLDEIIEHYGAEKILREIGVQDAIDYFEVPTVLRGITIEEAISHYGEGNLLDEIGLRESVDHWDTSDVFDNIDGWDYCREYYYDSMHDYVLDGFNMADRWDVTDVLYHYSKSELMAELLNADHKLVMQCTYNYVEDDELLNFFLQECNTATVEVQEHIKLISLIRLNNRK